MARGSLLAGAIVLVAFAPSAAAQQDYVGSTIEVKGTEVSRPAAAPAALVQESDPADPDDRIPITGGDVAGLVAIGLGSVALGMALTRRARRPG